MFQKIDEILSKIANDPFISRVYVGKKYSIKDLREDLEELREELEDRALDHKFENF